MIRFLWGQYSDEDKSIHSFAEDFYDIKTVDGEHGCDYLFSSHLLSKLTDAEYYLPLIKHLK